MHRYSVTFNAVAATTTQDLVEIVTPSTRRCTILGWEIGQSTEFGDAADEAVRLELISGHTTSGSGGSSFTPLALDPGNPVSLCTVEINNSTIATSGTAAVHHSTAFNVRAGHVWLPPPELRVVLVVSGRIVLRMNSTPADSISFSGTLYFEE